MSEISPLGSHDAALQRLGQGRTNSPYSATSSTGRSGDSFEFSTIATLLSELDNLPDIREDLVARVRSEIADDVYVTEQKIDAVLDPLLEEVAY